MPINRPQRPANHSRRPGGAIRSGMATTARIAGTATLLTVLFNSGPMLFVALGGCLFLFRGCVWSRPPVPQQTPDAVASPAYTSQRYPTPVSVSSIEPLPKTRRAALPNPERLIERPVIEPEPNTEVPELTGPAYENVEPLRLESRGGFFAMGPGFNGAPNPMLGFPPGNNFMMGMITEPPSPNDPPSFEESPLFDLQRGRRFLGTCQMPGSPSKRMSLALGAIRERGRNIEATLYLLESPRTTKAYTGVIEQKPLRLTLTPDLHPTNLTTFLTHMPWYSNSPTKITLSISVDGKSLSGTSISGEEFEFLPQQDRGARAIHRGAASRVDTFPGFDDASTGSTDWRATKRSSESEEGALQLWSFTQISDGEGDFVLQADGRKIANGTYLENASRGHLDIVLTRGQDTQIYRGLFKPLNGDQEGLQVCITRKHGEKRPTRIDSESGNLFELMPSDSKE